MKTRDLRNLQRQLTKELKQPLKLPSDFKEQLINRYGSVCNAATAVGVGYGTLYKMISEGSFIPKHQKAVAFLLQNDPKSNHSN